ncbi:MAG: hypothetical protein GQF41_2002 [Candidatus Rifleibacterium amylolyticum]|nr:MAG: hypothetical protein GQF41_2002 [Candidatus Rifleibacterium amylolyticum]
MRTGKLATASRVFEISLFVASPGYVGRIE